MKQLTFLSFLLTLSILVSAAPVSRDEMRAVAANVINPKTDLKPLRMNSSSTTAAAAFCLFEDQSGEGWALVAADDVAQPLLAYSKTGKFLMNNLPINISGWLTSYEDQIQYARKAGTVASKQTAEQWNKAKKQQLRKKQTTTAVEPLIKTKWDQTEPFNALCPYDESANERSLTGCVATAMAQLMYYHQWPIHGTGSLTYQPNDCRTSPYQPSTRFGEQSADFENTYYDWQNMLDYYVYQDENTGKWYYRTATDKQKEAVATLMYHCGVATQMMYGLNNGEPGSSTYTLSSGYLKNSAQYALATYFGYKSNMHGYHYTSSQNYNDWVKMLKDELDQGRPMLYGGYNQDLSYGHSFICDGYDANDYFHFNWGWSGMSDGYFLLSALTPGDGGAGGGTYDFKYNQEVIINIEPNRTGEFIEKEEPKQKDYTATKAAMTYYPESSDITTFKQNNVTISLYVTDEDDSYSAYFYFNVILPEYNRIDFGQIQTENEYTAVEILQEDEDWYYICGNEESTLKYYRYYYEYQQPNCKSSSVKVNYKGKDSKGNLLYDVLGTVVTTEGSVYTISAANLIVEGTSAIADSSQPDGYRYTSMSLIDDTPNYNIEVTKKPKLTGYDDDIVPIGVEQLKFAATLKNTGSVDFNGRLSALIYILKDGEWEYVAKTGHTAEITFAAGKTTNLTYTLQNTKNMQAGQYKFVSVYGKDASHWFEASGSSVYYFTLYDPESPDKPDVYTSTQTPQEASINAISIYSPTGILIKQIVGKQLSVKEQLNNLQAGMYILLINNKEAKTYIIR